jgi:hypothetical protein
VSKRKKGLPRRARRDADRAPFDFAQGEEAFLMPSTVYPHPE